MLLGTMKTIEMANTLLVFSTSNPRQKVLNHNTELLIVSLFSRHGDTQNTGMSVFKFLSATAASHSFLCRRRQVNTFIGGRKLFIWGIYCSDNLSLLTINQTHKRKTTFHNCIEQTYLLLEINSGIEPIDRHSTINRNNLTSNVSSRWQAKECH